MINFMQKLWRPLSGMIAALCLGYIGMVQWVLMIRYPAMRPVDAVVIGFITSYMAWCFSSRGIEKIKGNGNKE